jgi:integrase
LLWTFYELLENAGLSRICFHDLRHKSAGLVLSNGVAAIIGSKRLGHARVSIMEDVYVQLILGLQAEAVRLINELITPVKLPRLQLKLNRNIKNAIDNER